MLEVDRAPEHGGRGVVDLGDIAVHVADLDPGDESAVAGFSDGDRRAEGFRVEFAADGEHGVAEGLGVEALDAEPSYEHVVGVGGLGGVVAGGLAVGAAEEDLAVHGLEAPAGLHEPAGEVIEQFGMGRAFAQCAEVARGIDDATSEMVHPDAVHEGASDEGMAARGEPLGIGETPSGGGEGRVVGGDLRSGEDGEFAGGDGLPKLAVVPAVMDLTDGLGVLRFEDGLDLAFRGFGGAECGGLGTFGDDFFVGFLVVEVEAERGLGGEVFFEECRLFRFALGSRGVARNAVLGAFGLGHLEDFLLEYDVESLLCHPGGFGVDLGGFFFDFGSALAFLGVVKGDGALGRVEPFLPVECGIEHGAEAVIIGLADRIVAVVMALGAGDGEAGEGGGDDAEGVGDVLVPGELDIGHGVAGAVRGSAEEARGCEGIESGRVVDGGDSVGGGEDCQFIAGELFLNELVPRFVGVERTDHVVAVPPEVGPHGIGIGVPVGIGVAGNIEPVASPSVRRRPGRREAVRPVSRRRPGRCRRGRCRFPAGWAGGR